ncbi:MAG TPA: hypothetical protein VN812_13540 [Candidatus Acidoferrales bacterium]|nr:hypothetical protein [Candidatus Acidoferrales bacterium]
MFTAYNRAHKRQAMSFNDIDRNILGREFDRVTFSGPTCPRRWLVECDVWREGREGERWVIGTVTVEVHKHRRASLS